MSEIFICPNCNAIGIENFEVYEEKCITEWRKITKDGKISKKLLRKGEDKYCSMPWGLQCKSCNSLLNYYLDNDGNIIEIDTK
jgi:hypothetical protein